MKSRAGADRQGIVVVETIRSGVPADKKLPDLNPREIGQSAEQDHRGHLGQTVSA